MILEYFPQILFFLAVKEPKASVVFRAEVLAGLPFLLATFSPSKRQWPKVNVIANIFPAG
jgi:hypothetical protein